MQKKKKTRKKKKEGNDFFFLFHENDHEAEDRIMRSPAWTGDLKYKKFFKLSKQFDNMEIP